MPEVRASLGSGLRFQYLAGVVIAPAASAAVDQRAPEYYDSGLADTSYLG
ncbi:hypothetical protein [Kibdelosporangium aridum]